MGQETQPNCPHCGSRMIKSSNGADDHIRFECPQCPANDKFQSGYTQTDSSDSSRTSEEPRQRFRRLIQSADESKYLDLPESLIEDLPEKARELLIKNRGKVPPSIGPELSSDLAKALRDQGYVIDEDSRGMRISGHLTSRGSDPGRMSPYDILKMAADLEGGLQTPDERRRCSKCDAVLPKGHTTCDWCGESVDK